MEGNFSHHHHEPSPPQPQFPHSSQNPPIPHRHHVQPQFHQLHELNNQPSFNPNTISIPTVEAAASYQQHINENSTRPTQYLDLDAIPNQNYQHPISYTSGLPPQPIIPSLQNQPIDISNHQQLLSSYTSKMHQIYHLEQQLKSTKAALKAFQDKEKEKLLSCEKVPNVVQTGPKKRSKVITSPENEIKSLKEKLAKEKAKFLKLQTSQNSLVEIQKKVIDERADAQDNNKIYKEKIEALENEINCPEMGYKILIEKLGKEVNELKSELKSGKSSVDQHESSSDKVSNANLPNEDVANELCVIQAKNLKLERDLERYKEECVVVNRQVEYYEERNAEISSERDELKVDKKILEVEKKNLQDEIKLTNSEKKRLQKELEKALDENKSERKKSQAFEIQNKTLVNQVEQLESEKNDLKKGLDVVSKIKENLDKIMKNLLSKNKNLEKQVIKLKAEAKEKETEKQHLITNHQKEVTEQNEILTLTKNSLQKANENINQLQNKVEEVTNASESEKEQLQEELLRKDDRLREANKILEDKTAEIQSLIRNQEQIQREYITCVKRKYEELLAEICMGEPILQPCLESSAQLDTNINHRDEEVTSGDLPATEEIEDVNLDHNDREKSPRKRICLEKNPNSVSLPDTVDEIRGGEHPNVNPEQNEEEADLEAEEIV